MFAILGLYALAGALVTGGAAGGKYVFDVAQREAARDLARRDRRAVAEMLQQEVDLVELRQRAKGAGLDPEAVEQGYLALRDGRLSLDEVLTQLRLTA